MLKPLVRSVRRFVVIVSEEFSRQEVRYLMDVVTWSHFPTPLLEVESAPA